MRAGRAAQVPVPLDGEALDVTRYWIELVTTSGRAEAVEVRIRMTSVEVWHHLRCAGVLDRDVLRAWLACPVKPLVVDEVVFSLDRHVDRDGRVAVSLPDVTAWTLSPAGLAELRARV